jgi:glycosyltransferase involved in cell wall biosynthesis
MDGDRMTGRVCLIVHNQLWNDARVKKEASSLRDAGWQVTVVARPEPGRPGTEDWQGIRILRPRYRSAVTESLRGSFDGPSSARRRFLPAMVAALRRNRVRRFLSDLFRNGIFELKFLRAALSADADVYQANDVDTLLVAWLASRLRRARLVYDSHELWLGSPKYLREMSALGRLRDRLTERALVYAADAVIHVTPGRAEVMQEMYPRIRKMHIVENCPEVTEKLTSDRLRETSGAPAGAALVLYQGILANERGLENLLEAARELRGENLRIVLVGHDCTGGRLPAMATATDLAGIVTLLPPVKSEELPLLTAGADMGLILFQNTCLNHYYSLPNKLYEYMMAGIPVIASDLPEIARVVRDNGCGILVDPEDPASIALGIRDLLSRPAERLSMGQRAREAAISRHCWPVQARELISLYSSLAGEIRGR